MTKRAKRLAKFLDDLGWNVFDDDSRECTCGNIVYGENHKFCSLCGAKLPKVKKDQEVLTQLEDAIVFALEE